MGLQSQNDLSMISVHIIVSEIISVLGVAILNDLEWTGHHRYITVFQQLFGETNQAWKVVYVPIQKGYPYHHSPFRFVLLLQAYLGKVITGVKEC